MGAGLAAGPAAPSGTLIDLNNWHLRLGLNA